MRTDLPLYDFPRGSPEDGSIRDECDGRVLIWGGKIDPEAWFRITGGPERLKEIVTPHDIIWLPLYWGTLGHGAGRWPPKRLGNYERHLGALRELAPLVHGVIMGNQGCELSYRHLHGGNQGNARGNVAMMAHFVRQVAPIIKDAGAVPFFGGMDWDILQDCYSGGRAFRDALNETDSVNIICCGFTMLPGGHYKHTRLFHGQFGYARKRERDKADFKRLRAYISDGNFWCDVDGVEGLEAGNMVLVTDYGFKAATCLFPRGS